MLILLSSVGHGRHGERIPRCGAILREAKAAALVVFDDRGNPRLTHAGLTLYHNLNAEEAAEATAGYVG